MPEDKVRIGCDVSPETRDQFAIACRILGTSMTKVLRGCVARTIREGQERQQEMEPPSVWVHTGPAPEVRFADDQEEG